MNILRILLLSAVCFTLRAETPAPAAGPATVDWKMLDRTNAEINNGMRDAKIVYPEDLKALNNKTVTIVGFMTPYEDLDDMKQFLFMPSSGGCFFCNPPDMTQVLVVDQNDGKKRHEFISEPIIVTGTLRLFTKESKHPAHLAEFIYALDDAKVEIFKGKTLPTSAAPAVSAVSKQ
jgi:hypothetical protein